MMQQILYTSNYIEEASLVIKILGLAGITLNKPGLMQIGQQLDQLTENKEKQ